MSLVNTLTTMLWYVVGGLVIYLIYRWIANGVSMLSPESNEDSDEEAPKRITKIICGVCGQSEKKCDCPDGFDPEEITETDREYEKRMKPRDYGTPSYTEISTKYLNDNSEEEEDEDDED